MNPIELIKSWFSKAIKAFKSFCTAAFPRAKQIILGNLKDIAVEVVAQVNESSVVTNEAKRKAAFEAIVKRAKSEGIETRDHLIYLAIEMAVSALKGD